GSRSLGEISDGYNPWQLTVYKEEFKTPDWLAGGVLYQIFPDRFYKSGKQHENIPADRKIHENWNDSPDWMPNELGKITNNDYFGGDLAGITEKLDYIKSLGITCIYLNPIFEAHENHRYNTADYSKVDPMLGSNEDFKTLCKEAEKRSIRVILDGVFSHTGDDSVYFNKKLRYPLNGAYNRTDSPYFNWYKWETWPEKYHSWWGISTLPEIIEETPSYLDFVAGEDGIAQKWLCSGAGGWRLDVADELPDVFLDNFRKAVKSTDPDAVIIGEVWEDATSKIAYGQRRRYFMGDQLDSVMNYPFRNAIFGFLKGGNGEYFLETVLSVLENYPPQVIRLLMNHIGTHDTERAITALAGESGFSRDRNWQNGRKLSEHQRRHGKEMLRLASLLQFTLPGVPSVYYGDEIGTEGYSDPFNRSTYDWENQDCELIEWYKSLGNARKLGCFTLADFIPVSCTGKIVSYIRPCSDESVFVAVNSDGGCMHQIKLPESISNITVMLGEAPQDGKINLPPYKYCLLKCTYSPEKNEENNQ
ncbi:MAG: glycoside hydrolase family 13 protein, partial [Clostridia bacterium]|nr:glycoside hydrolase family 13 protein [Clostridia bacterium]